MKYLLTAVLITISMLSYGQSYCAKKLEKYRDLIKEIELKLDFGEKNYRSVAKELLDSVNLLDNSCIFKVSSVQFNGIKSKTKMLVRELQKINPSSYNYSITEIARKYSSFFNLVQNLDTIPFVIPDNLIYRIDTVVDKNIRKKIKPGLSAIQSLVNLVLDTLDTVSNRTQYTRKKLIGIDTLLRYQDVNKTKYASASAFADGLYSLSFTKIKYKDKAILFSRVYTAEFIFPLNSQNIINPGLFGSAGFYYKRFVLQAGLGFVDTKEYQNVSWKGSIDFLSDNQGLGFSYSPLTGAGVRLSLRFPIENSSTLKTKNRKPKS